MQSITFSWGEQNMTWTLFKHQCILTVCMYCRWFSFKKGVNVMLFSNAMSLPQVSSNTQGVLAYIC